MVDVYFGPFNDPGDTANLHHWDSDHDSDCHNPAFTVARSDQTLSVALALRPSPTFLVGTHNDCSIILCAAACGLLADVSDVESVISRVMNEVNALGVPTTYLANWDNTTTPALAVNAYSSNGDNAWISNTITWDIPKFANGVILVAWVTGTGFGPAGGTSLATQDPYVAIWVG